MRRWIIGLSATLVVLIIVLIVVLSNGSGQATTTLAAAGSSTTSTAETSTTAPATPTTAEATTTSAAESTTSSEETTTTSSTTTTVPVEGSFADEPLVVAGFGALGWWDGGNWVQVDSGTRIPVTGGESYQVALLGFEGTTTGGSPDLLCDPLNNPGVVLADEGELGAWPGPYGVAVSASWPLTPHLVQQINDDGTYSALAAELLSERGLDVPSPSIKQVVRFDIEGDGVNEVLVVAEHVSSDLLASEGDYSIAFLRRTIEGEVETAVLGDSVVVSTGGEETPFIISYSIGAVADLNGDGKMEIVLDSAYYEGLGVEVWEYVSDDIGPIPQITTGCGT